MPPNTKDIQMEPDTELQVGGLKPAPAPPGPTGPDGREYIRVFQSGLNFLAQTLIGVVVGVTVIFAFSSGLPASQNQIHIILCVIGYQFLMAHAILALTSENSWSSRLKLVNKRRFHWVLQIAGSGMALAGSFIRILTKSVHWDTLHGQFALVALVFTVASLFNGLASLYSYEFRKFLPMNLSKLTHICFGSVAFASASVALCYGFDKNSFRNWSGVEMTLSMIGFTSVMTFIIVINPLITLATKSYYALKK